MDSPSIYEYDDLKSVLSLLESVKLQGGSDAPAGRSLAFHIRGLGAGAVLREDRYTDRDYSRAYESFYGSFFTPPPKVCTRYHFLKRQRNVLELEADPSSGDYLGFVVVWPTEPVVIGRTMLMPPAGFEVLGLPAVAHIGAAELRFTAAPYATKDFGVAACATIATWVAAEIGASRFGLRSTSTAEITALAAGTSNGLGRVFPQRFGLDSREVSRALHAIGFEPFVYDMTVGFEWSKTGTIYGHLLSGIPIILMVDLAVDGQEQDNARHAITAVGFEFDLDLARSGGGWSRGMTSLVIHDDRYGPYLRAEIASDGLVLVVAVGDDSVAMTVRQIIVPLPPRTYTISQDAHIAGLKRVAELTSDWQSLVVRTRLVASYDLKRESISWLHPEVAAHLRVQALPSRVWLSEAFDRSLDANTVHARVVMDATVHRDASYSRYVWEHVGSQVMPPGSV